VRFLRLFISFPFSRRTLPSRPPPAVDTRAREVIVEETIAEQEAALAPDRGGFRRYGASRASKSVNGELNLADGSYDSVRGLLPLRRGLSGTIKYLVRTFETRRFLSVGDNGRNPFYL